MQRNKQSQLDDFTYNFNKNKKNVFGSLHSDAERFFLFLKQWDNYTPAERTIILNDDSSKLLITSLIQELVNNTSVRDNELYFTEDMAVKLKVKVTERKMPYETMKALLTDIFSRSSITDSLNKTKKSIVNFYLADLDTLLAFINESEKKSYSEFVNELKANGQVPKAFLRAISIKSFGLPPQNASKLAPASEPSPSKPSAISYSKPPEEEPPLPPIAATSSPESFPAELQVAAEDQDNNKISPEALSTINQNEELEEMIASMEASPAEKIEEPTPMLANNEEHLEIQDDEKIKSLIHAELLKIKFNNEIERLNLYFETLFSPEVIDYSFKLSAEQRTKYIDFQAKVNYLTNFLQLDLNANEYKNEYATFINDCAPQLNALILAVFDSAANKKAALQSFIESASKSLSHLKNHHLYDIVTGIITAFATIAGIVLGGIGITLFSGGTLTLPYIISLGGTTAAAFGTIAVGVGTVFGASAYCGFSAAKTKKPFYPLMVAKDEIIQAAKTTNLTLFAPAKENKRAPDLSVPSVIRVL